MFAIRAERESVTGADFDDAVRKVVGMPNAETQQLGQCSHKRAVFSVSESLFFSVCYSVSGIAMTRVSARLDIF